MKLTKVKKIVIGLIIASVAVPWGAISPNIKVKAAEPSAPPEQSVNAAPIVLPPKEGKIELTEKRTATSKTFLKSDGGKQLVVSEAPIHYQSNIKGDSSWQEIDNNLQDDVLTLGPNGARKVENKSNSFKLGMNKSLAEEAFSLEKNGGKIALNISGIESSNPSKAVNFNHQNLEKVQAEIKNNKATYKNIYPDTDLIYYSMPDGLKEDIIINKYSGQNVFTFDLNLENAYFEKQPDGSYKFFQKETKEFLFIMPNFYMWDSKGGKDAEPNQYSYNVKSEIVQNNDKFSVILTADDQWLSAPERVFPVTIDPSFSANLLEDTYVQTGYPDVLAWNQGALWVGTGETKGRMRALVLFNIPTGDLSGARITDARFEAFQYGNCTGVCQTHGVWALTTTNFNPWETTWNNRPAELAEVGNLVRDNTTFGWISMDVTTAAYHWIYENYDGSVPGGLEFQQDAEGNWGFRTWASKNNAENPGWAPRLTINYNDYNADYEPTEVPDAIAGTTIDIPVRVKNTGVRTWTTDIYKLGYHLINNSTGEEVIHDGGIRTVLPRDLPKGEEIAVLAKFKAPSVAGSYTIQWDMVQEGTTWFSWQGVPTANRHIHSSPPSFASMTHLGTESYYAKAGPVDLATGNLSYSSTDLAVNSPSGGLNITRSYNSNTLDQKFGTATDGYIRSWAINGPYKENNNDSRLTKSYYPSEDKVRPSQGSTSARNLWTKHESAFAHIDLNDGFDKAGSWKNGKATNVAGYANVYVYSETVQNVQLRTGSDDGIRIWLNGKMIRSNDIYRPRTNDSDIDNVTLNQGWNSLLIKISQGGGGWDFSARFTKSDGTPVSDLKYSLYNPEVFQSSRITTQGWSYSFDELLYSSDPENIYYRDGTGTVNIFTKNSDGSYGRPAGMDLKLSKNTDGTFYLESKSGVRKNFRSDGKIANVVDLLDNKLEYQYDTSGKCIKIVDGTRYINITYNGSYIDKVADALGNRVLYLYSPPIGDSSGRLERVIDPLEKAFGYEYGGDGKIIKYFDKKWTETRIDYASGKVVKLTDALGNATKFSYANKATEVTDALGKKSTASFNEANILTAFTNAKSYKELYNYDASYRVVSVTPAIPENDYYWYKWSYTYDGNGNLVLEKDPTDAATKYIYSGNDLISSTDPKGNVSEFSYSTDGKRLLTSSKDAQGNAEKYVYDAKGRVVSATDPKNAITKYTYNSTGDVASVTTPKNEIIKYGYDGLGRKTTEISPMGFITKYYYDKLSRLYRIVDPAGLQINYSYDVNNNQTRETYPNTTKKSFTYDNLDRLMTVIDETGAGIAYSYDTLGNKISMKDANGKTTSFIYDELNQLTQQTDPTGKTVKVNYDRNSNVASTVDPKGNVAKNTYDKSGALVSAESGGITANLALDANKNMIKIVTSNAQTTTVTYDKNNNPTGKSSTVLGKETTIYDQLKQVAAHTVSTASINIIRDANGAVAKIANKLLKTSTDLGATTYSNDPDGKLKVITKPNADTSTFSYDISGRVIKIDNKNKSGVVQNNFSYTYDLASNQTSILDNTGKKLSYAYDARNELITEGTKKYTYDPMGNRKTVTDGTKITKYEYDTAGDANRLKKVTYPDGRVVSYDYDDNGNIIKETDSKTGITAYTYDSDNYFTKATLPDKTTVQYTYDQVTKLRAQRILTTPAGVATTTKFVYSADRLVSETDTAGNVLKNYTWDEQENLISFTIPVSGVMTTYYYVKNAKGDVVGLSNKDGKMVVAYDYDAWGNITKAKNLVTTGIPADLYKQNPRLYASYWHDSALGLYFMKTRLYDSELGRFMSKDQAGGGVSALDFNPYLYCNNNPVTRIDPDGKRWWSVIAGLAVGAVIAIVAAVLHIPVGVAIVIAAAVGALVGAGVGAYQYYKKNKGKTTVTGYAKAITQGAALGAVGGAVGAAAAAAAMTYVGNIIAKYSSPPPVTTSTVTQNRVNGLQYEKDGLKAFNLIKNTQALKGGSIPDSTVGGKIHEFKNVQYITNSNQFRNYAADGRPINLYAPSSARISVPVQDMVERSYGEIIIFK